MQAYPHYLIDFARKFRKEQTRSEAILWQYLRNRKLHGLKFKRQHLIGNFIVDFYCRELKLVVELEGGVHEIPDQKEYDAVRFEELQNRGLRILRFKNQYCPKKALNTVGNLLVCNILEKIFGEIDLNFESRLLLAILPFNMKERLGICTKGNWFLPN